MFDIDTSEYFLVLWGMFNTFCTHSKKHIAKINNQMWHFCIHQTYLTILFLQKRSEIFRLYNITIFLFQFM